MAFQEDSFEKFRRLFLISNIFIVALITVISIFLAFRTCIDSCENFDYFFLVGFAFSFPGWAYLILYGFGCYDKEDLRRTVSAFFASLQIIVFLGLSIFYFVDYFF